MFSKNRAPSETATSATGQPEKSVTDATGQNWLTPPAWLAAAVTPEAVRDGLLRQVPEFASGRLVLERCEVRRLRFRDRQGCWTGTYFLTIEGLPSGRQTVPVQGTLIPPGMVEPVTQTNDSPFGTDQWGCYLPELRLEFRTQQVDTELAALPQLTDPDQARSLLEEAIRTGGDVLSDTGAVYRELRIQSCTPKVARYKPGSRCTVLYHLEYPPQLAAGHNWPDVVVAKTHHGGKGQNAFESMQALWRSPLGASDTVAIAEPLAYLPELNVLVQGPIREELTLKELIQCALRSSAGHKTPEITDELYNYMRKTAAGLAELHQCGVHYGESVTWENELAEIYRRRARLATPLPQLAGLAEDLLSRLQRLAALHPADPLAPAHRSFRPAQVLLSKGEIGFIDFDGFCQAEPAMDLALFMTTVKNLGINKSSSDEDEDEDEGEGMDAQARLARLTQAEAICQVFLAEYEKHAPVSRTRLLLWETLDLLSLVLSSWSKLKLARLENCQFMLERHVMMNRECLR